MNNSKKIENIWYATEQRALNTSKFLVYDDKGTLEMKDNKLFFLGSKGKLDFDQIQNIFLSRQRWNWKMWLLGLLLFSPIYYLGYLLLGALYDIGDIFILFFIACIVTGLTIGFMTKWIIVEYKNPEGNTIRSYLAKAGWPGILNGTKSLFQYLKNNISV